MYWLLCGKFWAKYFKGTNLMITLPGAQFLFSVMDKRLHNLEGHRDKTESEYEASDWTHNH